MVVLHKISRKILIQFHPKIPTKIHLILFDTVYTDNIKSVVFVQEKGQFVRKSRSFIFSFSMSASWSKSPNGSATHNKGGFNRFLAFLFQVFPVVTNTLARGLLF
eukprot:Lithocolla_globosa_v1_NODE_825_length_3226_cov_19.169032.p6 type:complete len:105 gc:universal NODE_825_length_3226_cov_19.169032:2762-3076(+)